MLVVADGDVDFGPRFVGNDGFDEAHQFGRTIDLDEEIRPRVAKEQAHVVLLDQRGAKKHAGFRMGKREDQWNEIAGDEHAADQMNEFAAVKGRFEHVDPFDLRARAPPSQSPLDFLRGDRGFSLQCRVAKLEVVFAQQLLEHRG